MFSNTFQKNLFALRLENQLCILNPYSATLFLDVALLSAALFMNVCSDNASLFCNANMLRLLTAFCSLDLEKNLFQIVNMHTLSFQ